MSASKKKYLVPYNFSRKSDLALIYALEHAQADPNTEFYIFHVFEDATKNFRRLDRLNEEYTDRMKQVVMRALEYVQTKGFHPNVENVHRRMSHGKAGPEILKMAEGISPDFIVMGAPTSNAFKKLVTQTPCTLVLVKEREQAETPTG